MGRGTRGGEGVGEQVQKICMSWHGGFIWRGCMSMDGHWWAWMHRRAWMDEHI